MINFLLPLGSFEQDEEVKRRELELIKKRLESVKDFLELVDVDRVVKDIREDRESK
jgi:hypothetical protein